MGTSLNDLRTEIADICHFLANRGHVVATSGNVSAREGETILITPTWTRKDSLKPDQIVECNLDGRPLDSSQRPSSEITMHRSIYGARDDVHAVIHAHCPYCTVCTINKISLEEIVLAEQVFYTGPAPTVPYAMPGSPDQAAAVEPYIAGHDSMLLERHGVLVLGKNLQEALNRMEQLEYAARIAYLASIAGKPQPLSPEDVEKLNRRTST
jgi:L-fuculose-phosphate aldolase